MPGRQLTSNKILYCKSGPVVAVPHFISAGPDIKQKPRTMSALPLLPLEALWSSQRWQRADTTTPSTVLLLASLSFYRETNSQERKHSSNNNPKRHTRDDSGYAGPNKPGKIKFPCSIVFLRDRTQQPHNVFQNVVTPKRGTLLLWQRIIFGWHIFILFNLCLSSLPPCSLPPVVNP